MGVLWSEAHPGAQGTGQEGKVWGQLCGGAGDASPWPDPARSAGVGLPSPGLFCWMGRKQRLSLCLLVMGYLLAPLGQMKEDGWEERGGIRRGLRSPGQPWGRWRPAALSLLVEL